MLREKAIDTHKAATQKTIKWVREYMMIVKEEIIRLVLKIRCDQMNAQQVNDVHIYYEGCFYTFSEKHPQVVRPLARNNLTSGISKSAIWEEGTDIEEGNGMSWRNWLAH